MSGTVFCALSPTGPMPSMPLPEGSKTTGSPDPTGIIVWQSLDKLYSEGYWYCPSCKFQFSHVGSREVIVILRGKIIVSDLAGNILHRLGAGDTAVFDGCIAVWEIVEPVTKWFQIRTAEPLIVEPPTLQLGLSKKCHDPA